MSIDRLVVACVQQRIRVPQSIAEYQEDLRRFLRIADSKKARLVVFPELAGMSMMLPLLAGFQAGLFKRAEAGRRRSATVSQRVTGALAQRVTTWLKADLRSTISGLLDVEGERVWRTYNEIFSGLAREFHLTLVAPSTYLPDPRDGVVRNISGVFGPNGALLGHQAKVMPQQEDVDIAKSGTHWDVIATETGLLGLMIGTDALFPEVGRVLAYQGAEVLIAQAACSHPATYNKLRAGILARMQDNQLFCVAAFAVGGNELAGTQNSPYIGKSAVFAPQELTPRYNGVLVEMGNQRSEGVLTAEWNFNALRELWDIAEAPMHRQPPGSQVTQILANLYQQLQSAPELPMLEVKVDPLPQLTVKPSQPIEPVITLANLAITAAVTSPWPLPLSDVVPIAIPPVASILRDNAAQTMVHVSEDETDEMDAV